MKGKVDWTARLTLPRRFLVLAALLFWQGGFTFYAAVVVPIGQEMFGLQQQGLLTRRVTYCLNLAGVVALAPLAWDVAVSRARNALRRQIRWAAWTAMLVTLILLLWLHQHLAGLVDAETHRVLDPGVFQTGHRWYLWLSTIQWLGGVIYAVAALQAWRTEDASPGDKPLAA